MKKLFFSLIICAAQCFADQQPNIQFIVPDQIPANYEKFNDFRKDLTEDVLKPHMTAFINKRCSDDSKQFNKLRPFFIQITQTMLNKANTIYLTNANNVETNEQAKEEIAALTNDYLHSVIGTVDQIDALFVEKENNQKSCAAEIEIFLKKASENSNDTTGGTH